MRILSEYRNIEKDCFSNIDAKQYSTLNVAIKRVRSNIHASLPFLTYFIIDGKELWAKITGDPTCPFKVVVTNCIPIVRIAQENFDKSWQDSNAELIFLTKRTNDLPIKVAPNSN